MSEDNGGNQPRSPLELIAPLGISTGTVAEGLRLVEIHTMEGLVSALCHGPEDAPSAVVLLGGANGGFLGPGHALYQRLADQFAELGIATLRVDYRRAGRLESSLLDVAAVVDLAARAGARRFVFVGHSFGGAVAVQAGLTIGSHVAGVVALATQSAGCEHAAQLGPVPLLLVHGESDQVLSPQNSHTVKGIAGYGELVIYPGATHGLAEVDEELVAMLGEWIPRRLADHAAR